MYEDYSDQQLRDLSADARSELQSFRREIIEGFKIGGKYTKITFKTECLREAFLLRMLDLSESFWVLFDAAHYVPAYQLVRSILETNAYHYMIYRRIRRAVEEGSLGDTDDMLEKFGLSFSGTERRNYKIKDAMDAIAEITPAYYRSYQFFCDFTHPNTAGMVAGYSAYAKPLLTSFFDPHHAKKYQRSAIWLESITMELFLKHYRELQGIMPDFSTLCETTVANADRIFTMLGGREESSPLQDTRHPNLF